MTTGQTDGKRSRQKVGRTDETGQGASVFAQLPSEYFGASGVALRFPPLGGNSPPVDMQGRPAKRERSLFSQVLDILEASGPMRICFDDLAGITVDYPELELSLDRLLHNCSYCRLAKVKSTRFRRQGVHDCASNKHATNHLLLKRRRGYEGLCHLGLFDIIEPVIYHGVILGSFYYGQVAVKQWRAKSRARIRRYCQRRGLDPTESLEAFRQVPVIDEADIPTYRARLKTTAAVLSLFCEALAVPVDRYQIHRESITWRHLAQKSPLVRAVVEFVSRHYSGPCRVSDLAKQFNCHPNYLGALFKVSVGQTLNEYVNRLRVERAQHLLRIGRLGVGEVGYRCGFSDPSHFGKIFRQFTGQSPQAFRESLKDEKAGTKPVHQP